MISGQDRQTRLDAPAERDDWPDLPVPVAGALPWIKPGCYQARTADLSTFMVFRRRVLRLDFDVYASEAVGGVVLARVPMYFRLPPPGRRLGASSKLARLFGLVLGRQRLRRDRLPMSVLKDKLFRVEVATVARDAEGQALAEANTYSVVRQVLERL